MWINVFIWLGRDREEDMAPVGCTDFCGLELLNKATKEDIAIGTCSINHLAVDSCFRRKGIGKILLSTAEKDALRHGCSVMDLLVASSNKARLFFEGQGYRALETDTGCCCGLWCMTGVWKLIRMEKKLSWQRNERVYNKQKWNELDEFVNFNLIYCFTCFRIFDIWKVKCVSVHICYTYLHVFPDCCVIIHHFINYIRFYQQ